MNVVEIEDKREARLKFLRDKRRNRIHNDPEYRERVRANERAYRKTYQKTEKYLTRVREYSRKRRATPEINAKIQEYHKKYKEKSRIRLLALNAIKRAKKSGVAFDAEYLKEVGKLRPLDCECCGKQFQYAVSSVVSKPHDRTPSLDRIDPAKGYVRGNVCIICWRCNAIKRDGVISEFESILRYMKSKLCL